MTNLAFADNPTTSSENRVIPFPSKYLASSTDSLSTGSYNFENFPTIDKEYLESLIYSMMIKTSLSNHGKISDPFGALYICDLQPDRINQNDFRTLNYLSSRIKDLSDEISFNDGMDD